MRSLCLTAACMHVDSAMGMHGHAMRGRLKLINCRLIDFTRNPHVQINTQEEASKHAIEEGPARSLDLDRSIDRRLQPHSIADAHGRTAWRSGDRGHAHNIACTSQCVATAARISSARHGRCVRSNPPCDVRACVRSSHSESHPTNPSTHPMIDPASQQLQQPRRWELRAESELRFEAGPDQVFTLTLVRCVGWVVG